MKAKLFVLVVSLVLLTGSTALATTINVSTFTDENNTNGNCALREAVLAANTDVAVDACPAGGANDTIILPAGTYTLSIIDPSPSTAGAERGDLDISTNMVIKGADTLTTIIDAGGRERAFDITGAISVTLKQLTIRGGDSGDLTVGSGGGIYINNNATVDIQRVVITENSADGGGGIFVNNYAVVTAFKSTISGNSSQELNGGGMSVNNYATVTLTDSTVSGNTADDGKGGGIEVNNGAIVKLINSTISGNTANASTGQYGHGIGGGINISTSGTVSLFNSTVAANTAESWGGGISGVGYTLVNTLIAYNTAVSNPDCSATVTSASYTMIGDATGCVISSGSTINGDAKINLLADNGGPTQTHKPRPQSPAVDGGDPAGCVDQDGNPLASDQRGPSFERPADGNGDGAAVCDIGAFEVQPSPVGGGQQGIEGQTPESEEVPAEVVE